MARIFTWTGRAGGSVVTFGSQFHSTYSYYQTTKPETVLVPAMGGYCLHLDDMGDYVKIAVGGKGEIYIGFRAMTNGFDAGGRLMSLMTGTTVIAGVSRYGYGTATNPFPRIGVYRGDNSTLLASTGIIDHGVHPYNLEFYYKPAASNGRWMVKVNGRLEVDYTGQTVPGSQTSVDYVVIGSVSTVSAPDWYVNDIVIDDQTWPGHSLFEVLNPTGAGYYNQWSPLSGDNYANVDENIPSLADYNYTNAADKIDSFACEGLPGWASAVKSVNIQVFAVKEGSPTPTQIKPLVRTGSTPTDYVGDGKTIGVYLTNVSTIWQDNPKTNSAWLTSEVNSLEFGYKSAS